MESVYELLCRYIDDYKWSWTFALRLVNRTLGTNYSVAELKRIYRENSK